MTAGLGDCEGDGVLRAVREAEGLAWGKTERVRMPEGLADVEAMEPLGVLDWLRVALGLPEAVAMAVLALSGAVALVMVERVMEGQALV